MMWMYRRVTCMAPPRFLMLPLAAALLFAGDPSWKVKPVSQWREDDAKQFLAASPWTKATKVAVLPPRGEDQLREGGAMGGGAVHTKRGSESALPSVLAVRWESAAPVRTAELLAHELGAPDWDGEYYVIAVYGVPGLAPTGRKALAAEFRRFALIKREGRKDLHPARVDVLPSENGLAKVIYFFSKSAPISMDDRRIEFVAQIGRMSLVQHFFTEEMQLQGKLEL
jgi:hypothetical protein